MFIPCVMHLGLFHSLTHLHVDIYTLPEWGASWSDEVQPGSSGRGDACSRVTTSRPDHPDDIEIAERHDGGRHNQYVAGEEAKVDFALPLGRVAARPAAEHRPTTSNSSAAVRRLDEDKELRNGEDERHQPGGDHFESDRRSASTQWLQWLHQHLRTNRHDASTGTAFTWLSVHYTLHLKARSERRNWTKLTRFSFWRLDQ